MRTIALSVLALLWPLAGHAQDVAYSQYGSSDGLPTDDVTEVVRDSSGFAWIGTARGLVRYDGQRFTSYRSAIGRPSITALHRRQEGGIWFATPTGLFMAVPTGDTMSVRRVADVSPGEDSTARPGDLYQDGRGRLWMGRSDGTVVRLQDGERRSYALTTVPSEARARAAPSVVFAEDHQNRLWAATPDGQLHRYIPAQDRFTSVAQVQLDDPHDLHIRHDTLWAAGKGLVRAQVTGEGGLENIRRFSADERTLTHVAFVRERLLLGSAENGLFYGRAEREDLALRPVYGANDPHRTEALPFQAIRHLYVDRDATIWVSSAQGLGLLQVPFFQVESELPNYTAFAVHSAPDGVFLSLGDAYRIGGERGRFPFVQPVPVTDEAVVTAVAAAGRTVWMGTSSGRLLTVESETTTRVHDLSGRGGTIFYVHDDRRGHVWICQAPEDTPLKGVTRMAPDGQLTFYDADDGLENRVLSLREGPDGTLYAAGIGPETYLHRYVPTQDRFVNISRPLAFEPESAFEVHDLAVGRNGTIWLATTAGLLRRGAEHTRRIDLGAYATSEIRAVEALPNGDVWLATATKGLLHYRNGTTVQFGQDRGLISTQMMYRTLRASGQGRLWAGTTVEGVVYSRDRVPVPDSTPPPRLLDARRNGRSLGTTGALRASAQETLTVRYGALVFPASGDVQYQYRVQGTGDSTWSDPSTDPTLRLPRVSARMEAIEVRARSGSGHYWSRPLRIPLSVRPVWYRRWWALVLFGLGAAGVVGTLVRFYLDRREARTALQEREARLRGIANSIPGVVFQATVHPDGTYDSSFVSEHAETLLGISAEPNGFHDRFVAHIPAPHRDAFQTSVEEAFETKTPWRHEMPFETPSGERLWLLGASMPERRRGETLYNGVILDITERKERERLLKEEQDALQSMYRVTADPEASFEEKVHRLLDLGREHLGLSYGFLARATEDTYEMVCASGTHPRLEEERQCALPQSYGRKVIRAERLLTVQDAVAEGWDGDPAHETFGFGSYIGAPVLVEGEVYGTYCFAADTARDEPFTDREQTFVELMAQWVSHELEQQRAHARLEHQNERLDNFAGLVTHDLRNPLNVALGRLRLAQEQVSEEKDGGLPGHLAAVERALGRMEALITDVLALTWGGRTIEDDEVGPCRLARAAKASWEHVDTAEATLRTEADLVVHAHEDRLRRLLENLFRNAVEHGGEGVTVRVGGLEEGFFVEDDGPGIPADKRETVLEEGYSSNEEGTGLGLSIVGAIAEAHGWSLSIAEGAEGGARFEIREVRRETAASEPERP